MGMVHARRARRLCASPHPPMQGRQGSQPSTLTLWFATPSQSTRSSGSRHRQNTGERASVVAMNERVRKLTEEIRKLSQEEQADLLEILQVLAEPDLEKMWAEEAERRIDAYDRGETKAEPLEDVMARLRSRYPRKT